MIYFAQDEATCRIKIGFTDGDPVKRLADLQTGCPGKLVLLATTDGDMTEEKRLHRLFAGAREHGEWFRPVPELVLYIGSRLGIGFAVRAHANTIEELFRLESQRTSLHVPEHERVIRDLEGRGFKLSISYDRAGEGTLEVEPRGKMRQSDFNAILKHEKAIIHEIFERSMSDDD